MLPIQLVRQKAFSLIEAAIVLAIVGIVLGSIWAVATTVRDNARAAETARGLTTLILKADDFFRLSDFPVSGSCANVDISTTVAVAGLVPRNWLRSTYLVTPLGGNIFVQLSTNCSAPYVNTYNISLYAYASSSSANKIMRALGPAVRSKRAFGMWCETNPGGAMIYSWSAAQPIPKCFGDANGVILRINWRYRG